MRHCFRMLQVSEKIGKVSYRLKLYADSKIHLVFHISQLKPVLGNHHEVSQLLTDMNKAEEVVVEPAGILGTRYDVDGELEALVKWTNLPSCEQTWV